MDPFKDSDTEDLTQSKDVMDHYEWAFADESNLGRLLTKWTRLPYKPSIYDDTVLLTTNQICILEVSPFFGFHLHIRNAKRVLQATFLPCVKLILKIKVILNDCNKPLRKRYIEL